MPKLNLATALQLLEMQNGAEMPSSFMKGDIVKQLLDDGIIRKRRFGRNHYKYIASDKAIIDNYINNHFGINNLEDYITQCKTSTVTKSKLVKSGSNSKLKQIRSFEGFLINSYQPIKARLSNKAFLINPAEGSFLFVSDYKNLEIPADITIVGIENAENFRYIQKQEYLFENIQPLFISRYPQYQHGDVIKWLESIPNKYLHFGDFDFQGINIYLREYKKYLGKKSSFFVPSDIATLVDKMGNRDLYNKQLIQQPDLEDMEEAPIRKLLTVLHKYKKCLEQEGLIM